MANKLRVTALTRRALELSEGRKTGDTMKRFKDAFARGKILCRDGKERSEKEWLKTLPKELA
jgi:hypothetical protein